jgi:hypothetical protein
MGKFSHVIEMTTDPSVLQSDDPGKPVTFFTDTYEQILVEKKETRTTRVCSRRLKEKHVDTRQLYGWARSAVKAVVHVVKKVVCQLEKFIHTVVMWMGFYDTVKWVKSELASKTEGPGNIVKNGLFDTLTSVPTAIYGALNRHSAYVDYFSTTNTDVGVLNSPDEALNCPSKPAVGCFPKRSK